MPDHNLYTQLASLAADPVANHSELLALADLFENDGDYGIADAVRADLSDMAEMIDVPAPEDISEGGGLDSEEQPAFNDAARGYETGPTADERGATAEIIERKVVISDGLEFVNGAVKIDSDVYFDLSTEEGRHRALDAARVFYITAEQIREQVRVAAVDSGGE